MKAIVGLGNPGEPYGRTRHNLGFRVVDYLCQEWRVTLKPSKACRAVVGSCDRFEEPLLLVKPTTYMNGSGSAVRRLLQGHSLIPSDLIVVVDDVSLSLGSVRIRQSGSPGGHKGLLSIIEALNTEDFPRLRLGVGPPDGAKGDLTPLVLGEFGKEEQETVERAIRDAGKALEVVVTQGLPKAMSVCNKRGGL